MSGGRRTAERPESVAEWEELLVRLEIAPRALRVALDDVPGERVDPAAAAALEALAEAEREAALGLATMRGEPPAALPDADRRAEDGDAERRARAALERFTRIRTHLFNSVQRRGLDVWDWRHPERGTTAFQLLSARTAHDGEVLAAVRQAARSRGSAC